MTPGHANLRKPRVGLDVIARDWSRAARPTALAAASTTTLFKETEAAVTRTLCADSADPTPSSAFRSATSQKKATP